MSSDGRDWHRDWWRKKTGYVERSSFRISMAELELQRQRKNRLHKWKAPALAAFTLLVLISCLIAWSL